MGCRAVVAATRARRPGSGGVSQSRSRSRLGRRPVLDAPASRPYDRPMASPAPRAPWYVRLAPLVVLAAGVLCYAALLVVLLLTGNTTMFPALLLVGALTVPLTVLAWAMDGPYGALAPALVVVVAMLLGGIVGILGAGLFESMAASALGDGYVLLVGLIEESVKLVVPVAVLLASRGRLPHAGVLVGVATGAGFAVLETMGYGFNALLEKGGGIGAVDATLLLRGVLVPAGHVAWTGVVCAALWAWHSHARHGAAATLAAYVAAVVLHTLWDASGSAPVHVVVAVVSIAGLLAVVRRAHRAQSPTVPLPLPDPGEAATSPE